MKSFEITKELTLAIINSKNFVLPNVDNSMDFNTKLAEEIGKIYATIFNTVSKLEKENRPRPGDLK
ncbi:hypothetical protein CTH_2301 [Carboxydocella thermautotrophica]|nr:hypothetical protein CTH_2301 [Carboxydocella thermautotrophica]